MFKTYDGKCVNNGWRSVLKCMCEECVILLIKN